MSYGVFSDIVACSNSARVVYQHFIYKFRDKLVMVIALYSLISSKQFTKATSWVERAIALMFSRVDWESGMNESLNSF